MIPVSSIEYVNVRIRGFHSRLFRRDAYEALMEGDTLGTVTTFLLEDPTYRPDIEHALERLSEREGLERGVTDHFARCVNHVYRLSEGLMRELFTIGLASFDLRNIRAVILAHRRGLSFRDMRHVIIPCGTMTRDKMQAAYDAGSTRDLLPNLPTCCPLVSKAVKRALETAKENEPVVDMVNRLENNLYSYILRRLEADNDDVRALKHVYRYEVDLKNIVSSLKHVWRKTNTEPGMERYLHGGTLNEAFLVALAKVKNLDEALEMIETTKYHEAVEKGVIYYAETGFLHEMERFFEEVFIRRTQSFRRFQPFGIGPFIAYVWAQYAEMTNLRSIINGIAFKTGAGQMRKGLIYV